MFRVLLHHTNMPTSQHRLPQPLSDGIISAVYFQCPVRDELVCVFPESHVTLLFPSLPSCCHHAWTSIVMNSLWFSLNPSPWAFTHTKGDKGLCSLLSHDGLSSAPARNSVTGRTVPTFINIMNPEFDMYRSQETYSSST